MHGIEGLDIIGNEMNELSHDGFDTCGIAGRIGRLQEHAVQPFVVRTDSQALTRRPFGATGVQDLEAVLGITAGQIDHDGFDSGEDPFENYPVGRTKSVEGPTVDQAQGPPPVIWDRRLRQINELVPVGSDVGPQG